ncbi:MAG: PAS domain S-box protein [Firmicutes bacterium]|nr:PAS domain S-box protein [Bacillota bacterium]
MDEEQTATLQNPKIDLTQLLAQSLDVINDGIHIIDRDGVTVFYSRGLEKIERNKASSVVGKHISETYRLDEESSILLKVLKSGEAITNHRTTYYTKKGNEINIITNTYPLFAGGGRKIIGAVSVNSNITSNKQLVDTVIHLQRQLYSNLTKNGTRYNFEDIIGESTAIKSAVQLAKRIAVNMSPVLIYGETGTGKELFAQSIHNHSIRAKGPFVAVNCAAIPATLLESVLFGTVKGAFTGAEDKTGLFEEADQGTLFLDEISSMDISLQSKLLRVLESKTVRRLGGKTDIMINPRIISAINIDPQEAINKNLLRQDLYFRLAVVTLSIAPLRERTVDIAPLTSYFINATRRIMNKKVEGASAEVINIFLKHNWPGNVRELQHAVEHAMNYAEDQARLIELKQIPPHLLQKYGDSKDGLDLDKNYPKNISGADLKEIIKRIELDLVQKALKTNDYNITKTARSLGMSRQNLQQRIKRLSISF